MNLDVHKRAWLGLAVKESSDSEPRRGAGEAEGEGGGRVQKKLDPEINFSLRALQGRVSL